MSAELRHLHIFQKPTHWSRQHRATCAYWHSGALKGNVLSLCLNTGGTEDTLGREKAYIPDIFPFSCFFRCLSRLVCWPKHLSHKWHLNGFSLLWMLRTCLCRLEDMLKDLSQYLHLKKIKVGRKGFVNSWKCKICPKRHEEPSGFSLSTQPQFFGPYWSTTLPETKTSFCLHKWRAVLLEWSCHFYGGLFSCNSHKDLYLKYCL